MSTQSNSQGPLSDLPHLHIADESNMAAEIAELEICRCKRQVKSVGIFWFLSKYGAKTKEDFDKTRVICRLCRKQSGSKGLWHVCFIDFVSVSLEQLQCNLKLNKEHEPLLVELVFEAFSGPF